MDLAITSVRSLIRANGSDQRKKVLVQGLVGRTGLDDSIKPDQPIVIDRELVVSNCVEKEIKPNACLRRRGVVNIGTNQLRRTAAHVCKRRICCCAESVV